MKQINRHMHILEKLDQQKKVEVEMLANELNVSEMTVRRDLEKLETNGELVRTFGGAIPVQTISNEISYKDKKVKNVLQKRMIAEKAVEKIENNHIIFLDSGTTTLEISKKILSLDLNLTVITNDISIANVLMDSNIDVIVLGGHLQNNTGSILGTLTFDLIKKLNADLFFLGAHAVDEEYGITAPSIEKAQVKIAMMQSSKEVILVTDKSKYGNKALFKVCELDEINEIITD
ncbi:DeoR/GlpR family DNA-binding transcription regulator [Mammaliicoccus lentus]|uniref:DeoR/GlpR family DNA-binding transcription regulator n=1 Tax=Mammaliicoccus lentus TaxID=42858 RepID=UPI003A599158